MNGYRMPMHGLNKKSRIKADTALLEQVTGIEPARPAWEAGVLPLNYTCVSLIISHISGKINRSQKDFRERLIFISYQK